MGDIDCRRFARQVATHGTPQAEGPLATFHYYMHWMLCAFCRQYWRDMKNIGEAHRSKITEHPLDLPTIQGRLRHHLKTRFPPPS
jgi:hypothetical protein